MKANAENVMTLHMQYGADNPDGSFELNWHFQHNGDRYTVVMNRIRKARGTEDDAHRACIDFINGKNPRWPVRKWQ